MRHVVAALAALVLVPAARADRLGTLLDAVAANARAGTSLRADGRLTVGEAGVHDVVLIERGDAVYVELRDGQRAIVRPDGVTVAGGGTAGQPLAGSALRPEDLAPFAVAGLRFPQISDEGPDGVVVTAAPGGPSPYALLVHTVDPERAVIVKTQYYAGTVSNLAKLRRNAGWTQIGGRWRPREITIEPFDGAPRTALALTWRQAPDAPATLFDPAALARPSNLFQRPR